MNESLAARAWRRLGRHAAGRRLFTRLVSWQAPYFGSLRARFSKLDAGQAEVLLKKRRRVQNHLKTVHAIAMANLCELAAGTMMEVTVPAGKRWIPRSMQIRYLAPARTDVRAVATLPVFDWEKNADVAVAVHVYDADGNEVLAGEIVMYVSQRGGP